MNKGGNTMQTNLTLNSVVSDIDSMDTLLRYAQRYASEHNLPFGPWADSGSQPGNEADQPAAPAGSLRYTAIKGL